MLQGKRRIAEAERGESAREPDGGRDTGKGFFCERDQRDRLSEGHRAEKGERVRRRLRYGRKERCSCQHKRN